MTHSEAALPTPDWVQLTSLPDKRRLYEIDSYFVEGYGDLYHRLAEDLYCCMQRHALVLFKPEAIRSRKIAEALDCFRNHGFLPSAASICRFDQATIHSIWRFQLQRATRDRIKLYSRWGDPEPAMMVAFRSNRPRSALPESVRLQSCKGHAFPERRKAADLRAQLKSPNTLMTFFHAADEPADMIRDMAICIPARDRMRFIDALAAPTNDAATTDQVLKLAEQLYQRVPEVSCDPELAADRLIAAVQAAPIASTRRVGALTYLADVRAKRTPLVFEQLEHCLGAALDHIAPYDLFVFATQYIERDRPTALVELAGDCVTAWHALIDGKREVCHAT